MPRRGKASMSAAKKMYLMASGSRVSQLDFVRWTPELYTNGGQTAGGRRGATGASGRTRCEGNVFQRGWWYYWRARRKTDAQTLCAIHSKQVIFVASTASHP